MKKTITVESVKNKIIVTYFNGEYLECFFQFKEEVPDDESRPIDLFFDVIVKTLDKKVRGTMTEMGIEMEKMGIGKHIFKYDR